MHEPSINEHKTILLSAWIEGQLSPEQQSEFEQLCTNDPEFAKQVENANYLGLLKDTAEVLEAPNWNKEARFVFPEKTPWWQWQAMPAMAMGFSLVAIFMVLTGFNISIENDRASFGFGSGLTAANVEEIVQTRLSEYQDSNQDDNQALLAQYVENMQQQQLQTSAQLTEYLLTSSRQERREDFAELIKFVNQQRFDDQVFYARQLNDLQQDINLQTGLLVDAVVPVSDISIND